MKTAQIAFLLTLIGMSISHAQSDQFAAFSESYTYEYSKDYPNAIAALDKVYSKESYELNLRMGWLAYMNADYLKSQAYYNTAIALEPSSIEARLGYAYPTAALENWEDVIKTYKKILTVDPNNFNVNSKLAHIYYNRKDFESALDFAGGISKLYPFDYTTNLLMGKIYIGLGKIVSAKTYLNKALLYSPSSAEVLELLKTL